MNENPCRLNITDADDLRRSVAELSAYGQCAGGRDSEGFEPFDDIPDSCKEMASSVKAGGADSGAVGAWKDDIAYLKTRFISAAAFRRTRFS